MLLYVDEYDDDTLDSLGLDEVDCHPMSNLRVSHPPTLPPL